MDPIGLIITLLVVALIIGIAWWALSQIALPPPIHMIVVVVVAIILILVVVNYLLPLANIHR